VNAGRSEEHKKTGVCRQVSVGCSRRVSSFGVCLRKKKTIRVLGRSDNEERRIRVSDQVGVCRHDERRRRRPRLQTSHNNKEECRQDQRVDKCPVCREGLPSRSPSSNKQRVPRVSGGIRVSDRKERTTIPRVSGWVHVSDQSACIAM